MSEIPDLHVVVKFGKGIPSSIQGPALLKFEAMLRDMLRSTYREPIRLHELVEETWVEVFKEAKGDDSMLRARMTPEQRQKL